VGRTEGAGWDKWAEYGGINDWFPGDWPGTVWNNDWTARAGQTRGKTVSVTLSARTKDDFSIHRDISVTAGVSAASVAYEFQNVGNKDKEAFWNSHPDIAPGGETDLKDTIVVPTAHTAETAQEIRKAQYFPRLQKTHYVPGDDWMLAYDPASQEYLAQKFDRAPVEKVGIWEGKNFFTMELIFRKMYLAPGAKKSFRVDYLVGQGGLDAVLKNLQSSKE
jgi:hypothetical protein